MTTAKTNSKDMLLLPHQYELLADTTTRIIGICSGYGGGKTYAAARKAVLLATLNPGFDGIITEPTFPLLTQVMFPELKKALEYFEIEYRFNKVESIFYCIIEGKETRIICGSMENYERLVGINAAWIVCDEFDTSKSTVAYDAYIKLLGRLRAGIVRQFVIVSTPEGFKAMYRIFVKEDDESKRLIKARTTDNKHLPQDYIETLKSQYPENLLNAYINGEFVNLTSGTVYTEFDRVTCDTDVTWNGREALHIGLDFNVTNMSAIVSVIRKGVCYDVDEITGGYDTPSIINSIQERYQQCQINIYPDASGKNRNAQGASESSIQLLKQAGFQIYAKNKNPFVKDRILAMNNSFTKRQHFVNVKRCPMHAANLEQQVYNTAGEPDKAAGNDHTNDANGYLIHYKYPVIKPTTTAARLIV